MSANWYVLRSKPCKEEIVWQQAESRGFETFYPRLHVTPKNPRARKVKPYFPGYMFLKANLEVMGRSVFQYMPYTYGLVCFGGEPASVPEVLIHKLRRKLSEVEAKGGQTLYELERGDRVWIHDGPFEGYKAIFDARISGFDRVRVLLEMLSDRFVPLEIDAAFIEKAR